MNWLPLIFTWLWDSPITNASDEVLQEEHIHGLRGLLYTLAPDDTEARVNQKARMRNIAHHLQVEQILSMDWPVHLGKPLVMKGFDYSTNLYPDIALRHANDIDLLVSGRIFDEVASHLSKTMKLRAPPQENRLSEEAPSALTFEKGGITIDLHNSPVMQHQTQLDPLQLIKRALPGKLGQCDVLYPCSLDRLWLWLQNFAKNFQPIATHQMVDLVLILKSLNLHQDKASWLDILTQGQSVGLEPTLRLSLHYLHDSKLWKESCALPIASDHLHSYHLDRWLRTQTHPNLMANTLRGILLIYRTVPGGRLAVTRRLFRRLFP